MINVANLGIKPYKFKDGDKVITTNNPTQEMYMQMASGVAAGTQSFEVISNAMNHMLKEEDKHYLEELDFTAELMLVQDYFQFHSKQLEDRFPDTDTTK